MAQTVTPYLLYEDTTRALEWLANAFGFRERLRFEDDEGRVTHAEMEVGDGEIFLGWPGPNYRSPRSAGVVGVGIHAYVDDVDAHYERARAAGAEITDGVAEQPWGERSFYLRDPFGNKLCFVAAGTEFTGGWFVE